MIGVCLRHDIGDVPAHIAGAVVQTINEALFARIPFPCTPIVAECYPEGAIIKGECRHTQFLRVILLPASMSIHERDFHQRWGSRQSIPLESKEEMRN